MKKNLIILILFIFSTLFNSCADLEEEYQENRTIIFNMNYRTLSVTRNANAYGVDKRKYKTQLIIAVPEEEVLKDSYQEYNKVFDQVILDYPNTRVSMQIPIDTNLKIIAYLFENKFNQTQLNTQSPEADYFGESNVFLISEGTVSVKLYIGLMQAFGLIWDQGSWDTHKWQ